VLMGKRKGLGTIVKELLSVEVPGLKPGPTQV
jgi:hypothetical protein